MVLIRDQWKNFPRDIPIVGTTFDFNWETLDDIISLDKGCRAGSVIFADRAQYEANCMANSRRSKLGGYSFTIELPKNIGGSFHPKVGIGLSHEGLILLVGSHNLTESALRHNLELSSVLKVPLTDKHLAIIDSVASFLEGLRDSAESKQSKDYLSDLRKVILEYSIGGTCRTNCFFLHSYEESILDQVEHLVHDVTGITVLSPTHSQNDDWVRDTINRFGGKATFLIDPRRMEISPGCKSYESHESKIIDTQSLGPLHAKLYLFHTNRGDWMLFGSPNFTAAALTKIAKEKGGNVETAILVPPGDPSSLNKLIQALNPRHEPWTVLPRIEPTWQRVSGRILIDPLAFEGLDGLCSLGAPGLLEGSDYIIRFSDGSPSITVRLKNGVLRFATPLEVQGALTIEILAMDGTTVGEALVNRIPDYNRSVGNDPLAMAIITFLRKMRGERSRVDVWLQSRIDGSLLLGPIPPPNSGMFRFSIFSGGRANKDESAYGEARKRFIEGRNLCKDMVGKTVVERQATSELLVRRAYYLLEGAFLECLSTELNKTVLVNSVAELQTLFEDVSNNGTIEIISLKSRFPLPLSLAINFWLYQRIYARLNSQRFRDYDIMAMRYKSLFARLNEIYDLNTEYETRSFLVEDLLRERQEHLQHFEFLPNLPDRESLESGLRIDYLR